VGFDNVSSIDPINETGFGTCCGSTNKNRSLALVTSNLGGVDADLLRQRVGREELDIYIAAESGALANVLRRSHRAILSEYFDHASSGDYVNDTLCEDLTNLSFDDESLDLVLSEHVLEHVHDPHQAFREIARVLRPGGRFVFRFPSRHRVRL
jgi:SAM-dependent methyltransferase